MSVSLIPLHLAPMAQNRLVCVPFAGAGASIFSSWGKQLPAGTELFALQLPGRETAARVPFCVEWNDAIESAISALRALPPIRTSLFGHSIGALIALDLARALSKEATVPLAKLTVAGRPWPGAGPLPAELSNIAGLDDEAFLAAMEKRYGPMHESLKHPEIAQHVLPILRADLQLLSTYQYQVAKKLRCPLTVFYGDNDPITKECDGKEWSHETFAPAQLHTLPAGHYFVESHAAELIRHCV